jgi:hypothetical protein
MKDGIVLQEKDSTGAIWLWINNATNSHPSVWSNSLCSPSTPGKPANMKQYGETRHEADLVQHKVEPHPTIKLKPVPPEPIGHDIPNPTASVASVPFILDIIPYGEIKYSADAMREQVEPIQLSKANPAGVKILRSPPSEGTHFPPSSPHALQSGPTQLLAQMVSEQSIAIGPDDSFPSPSPPPRASVVAAAPSHKETSSPTALTNITAASCPAKHRAVVAMLIVLTEGVPGKKVRMEKWMNSLRQEYPGAREAFLLSLIAEAEEDGVITRRRDKDSVVWAWLNPAKKVT